MSLASRKTSITSYLYSSIYKNRRRQNSLRNSSLKSLQNKNRPSITQQTNKKLSSTRSVNDSNQMILFMNNNNCNHNHNHNTNQNGKEPTIINDSESRDMVTVGSNEEVFFPTFNNTKRSQNPFQVLTEENDENIIY